MAARPTLWRTGGERDMFQKELSESRNLSLISLVAGVCLFRPFLLEMLGSLSPSGLPPTAVPSCQGVCVVSMAAPDRSRLEVYQTLFLRELLGVQAAEGASAFIVARPPGLTVLARRARLLGVVVLTERLADGSGQWVVLDDSTATCGVRLLPDAVSPSAGDLLEVMGDLKAGPSAVYLDCSHSQLQTDPEYELIRWRTLQKQRQNEIHAVPQETFETTHRTLPAGSDAADVVMAERPYEAPPETAPCAQPISLRGAVMACLSLSGAGVTLPDLEVGVQQKGAIIESSSALVGLLANMEEDFLIYQNDGKYHLL